MAALIPALIKLFLDSRKGGKGSGSAAGYGSGKPQQSDADKAMYYLNLDAKKDAIKAKSGRVNEVIQQGFGGGWENFRVPQITVPRNPE